jgi:hypothetical protein
MKITTLIDEKDLLSRDYLSKIKGGNIDDPIDSWDDNTGIDDPLDSWDDNTEKVEGNSDYISSSSR